MKLLWRHKAESEGPLFRTRGNSAVRSRVPGATLAPNRVPRATIQEPLSPGSLSGRQIERDTDAKQCSTGSAPSRGPCPRRAGRVLRQRHSAPAELFQALLNIRALLEEHGQAVLRSQEPHPRTGLSKEFPWLQQRVPNFLFSTETRGSPSKCVSGQYCLGESKPFHFPLFQSCSEPSKNSTFKIRNKNVKKKTVFTLEF